MSKWDLSELYRITDPYVQDNLKQGWPQYNIIDWCVMAYPHYAEAINKALEKMKANAEVLSTGTKRIRTEDVLEFVKVWKLPCRDVRRLHADQQ